MGRPVHTLECRPWMAVTTALASVPLVRNSAAPSMLLTLISAFIPYMISINREYINVSGVVSECFKNMSSGLANLKCMYMVTHLLAGLGWVDLDLG